MDKHSIVDDALLAVTGMGLTNCYMIVPDIGVRKENILNYWRLLQDSDRLADRFGDIPDITPEEIVNLDVPRYFVVDCESRYISAEFSLDSFTGNSAQIHFSISPDVEYKTAVFLGEVVTDTILYEWESVSNMQKSYLDTLFGLTPIDNRAACLFVLKSGYTKLGTLPNGTKFRGKVTDAMVSIKSRL